MRRDVVVRGSSERVEKRERMLMRISLGKDPISLLNSNSAMLSSKGSQFKSKYKNKDTSLLKKGLREKNLKSFIL